MTDYVGYYKPLNIKNIRIHEFDEHGIEPQPHGWEMWSEGIKAFLHEKQITLILSIPVNEKIQNNIMLSWVLKRY